VRELFAKKNGNKEIRTGAEAFVTAIHDMPCSWSFSNSTNFFGQTIELNISCPTSKNKRLVTQELQFSLFYKTILVSYNKIDKRVSPVSFVYATKFNVSVYCYLWLHSRSSAVESLPHLTFNITTSPHFVFLIPRSLSSGRDPVTSTLLPIPLKVCPSSRSLDPRYPFLLYIFHLPDPQCSDPTDHFHIISSFPSIHVPQKTLIEDRG
jgi:hypothetical protein